ncbi:uncharacterized protein V6R79_007276 [Siganus canaliculatus]
MSRIRDALTQTLQSLSQQDLDRFRVKLWTHGLVRRNQVENKGPRDIADVMVSAFGERGAVSEAQRILRDLNLGGEAASLGHYCLSSGSASGAASCLFQRIDRLI